jgi:DNA polymerase-3 subunit gamma/tau
MPRPAEPPTVEAATTAVPADPPAPVVAAAAPMALYRRWRAQRFGELIGQDHVVTTLRNAVASDRIAHAYLFVGPRGTGKTSTARILAKAINCTNRGADGEPCDTCPACVSIREGRAMDVIEIDAASHGLVEDARDLVMRALTAPAELRRRVYIVDEVHMLSAHAFNALLKMIEEPPPHVVFILATTDTHKVPATIISRTQRFDFHRMATDVIAGKLRRIVEAEHLAADPEALDLVARLADGGMRDAESLLDQVLAYAGERVTPEAVRTAVGLADDAEVAALIDAYLAGNAGAALDRIEALDEVGRDMGQVAAQAEQEARRRLLRSAGDPALARRLAGILRILAEAASAGAREGRARLALELLAVDPPIAAPAVAPLRQSAAGAPPRTAAAAEPPRATRPAPDPVPVAPTRTVAAAPAAPPPVQLDPPAPSAVPADPPAPEAPGISTVAEVRTRWGDVVHRAPPAIKPLLTECRPVAVDGARLTLAFPEERGFMKEKVATKSAAIEQLLGSVLGGSWAVSCITSNVDLEPLTIAAVGVDLQTVLQITGGELLDAPEVH